MRWVVVEWRRGTGAVGWWGGGTKQGGQLMLTCLSLYLAANMSLLLSGLRIPLTIRGYICQNLGSGNTYQQNTYYIGGGGAFSLFLGGADHFQYIQEGSGFCSLRTKILGTFLLDGPVIRGVVASYQVRLILPSVAETHPKMYPCRCNLQYSICRHAVRKV